MKRKTLMTPTTTIIARERYRTFALRGISVSMADISSAILPIAVFAPVATTTALPLPATTLVPLKSMLRCSGAAMAS